MKGNKMSNIWQILIECILHIFIEKSQSKFAFHPLKQDSSIGGGRVVLTTLLKLPKNWVIYIYCRKCLVIEKKILRLEFFLTGSLNLTLRILTWRIANDLHKCKKYEKPAKHVILIWSKKQYNVKSVWAVTMQKYYNYIKTKAPKFQSSLIFFAIHNRIVNFFYKCAQC